MIRIGDLEGTFITVGGRIINTIYKGGVIVWQNLVGWWINDRAWLNDSPWKNE
jgi:hypothetical protein